MVITRMQEITFGVLQVVKNISVLVKKSVQRKLPDEVAGAAVPEVVEVPGEAAVDLAEAVASEEVVVDLGEAVASEEAVVDLGGAVDLEEAVASEVAIVAMAEATMADGGPIMALA
jgi:hypothetical protein